MAMNLEEMIVSDEGEVLHAYQDSLGYWTIGSGVLIDERKGGGITREESRYLLRGRISALRTTVQKRIPWFIELTEVRQAVLLNMAYQMGVEGLLKFVRTLAMIRDGDYSGARDAMLQSKWATQTPARARRLAKQLETGVWQYQ